MSEQVKPVEYVAMRYICDDCGEGEMIAQKMVLLSMPPHFPHVCNKCGAKKTFRMSYPTTGHRDVPGVEWQDTGRTRENDPPPPASEE